MWEKVPDRLPAPVPVRVISGDGKSHIFHLGAHAPQLCPEDVELIHRIWLDLTSQPGFTDLHHRDIVSYALIELQSQLASPYRMAVLKRLGKPGN